MGRAKRGSTAIARDSKGLWLKGQSGNPSGRLRKTDAMREAEAMARDRMPGGVERLWDIIISGADRDSIKAMQMLYAIAGMGKAAPDPDDRIPYERLTREEKLARIDRGIERLKAMRDELLARDD